MAGRSSARILALLELADEAPTVEELAGYLADPDAEVRRTALSVLSEAAEDWAEASPVFAAALADPDAGVRDRAIDLLAELREVLIAGTEFADALRAATTQPDPAVRIAAIGSLWRHGLSTEAELTGLLNDSVEYVRAEAILGLVSLDALDAIDAAAADPSATVRLAVARAVAAVGDPRGVTTLITLSGDSDPLVRAAALNGMAATGCTEAAVAIAASALTDPAWQVRQGAAAALSAADPADAVGPLITAATDGNLDVRKAAVRALLPRIAGRPAVRAALEHARSDVDADVRAFARMGLTATDHDR
ncbi:HEAT repeat protein [Saccharomonospora amisosensis]|uniref:HEAT repeat protein n=1 Tax=Saccharomonospora amisosensis TaxID=1128677 RepID=A0A7X5ZQX7_9PSEU|nr:HEAT repeat domain-containing protein [Saccharomonospora amisosensis]NIJ11936.1 HEAT repeat protein [Saccharomonospora amisosensis]